MKATAPDVIEAGARALFERRRGPDEQWADTPSDILTQYRLDAIAVISAVFTEDQAASA